MRFMLMRYGIAAEADLDILESHFEALPTPATHSLLASWKAGEILLQTLLGPETVFHARRGAQPLFNARFVVKTLSGTLLSSAFHASGLRDQVLFLHTSGGPGTNADVCVAAVSVMRAQSQGVHLRLAR